MTQPAAQPAANDKTTLFGVLGIVFSVVCCPIIGVIFSVLSMNEAKKYGKQPTLAYVGFALAALFLVLNIVLLVTGNLFWYNMN